MKKLPIILAGCFLFIACDRSIESRLKQQQTKETVRATGDIEDKSLLKPSMFKTAREVADEQRLAEELALEEENARRLEEEKARKFEEEKMIKFEEERLRQEKEKARIAQAKAIEEKEKQAVEKGQKSTQEKSIPRISSIISTGTVTGAVETKKSKMLATVPVKTERTKSEITTSKTISKPSTTMPSKVKLDHSKIERDRVQKARIEKERVERERENTLEPTENRRATQVTISSEEQRLGVQRPLSKTEIQFFKGQCRYAFMSEQDIISNRCQAKRVVRRL